MRAVRRGVTAVALGINDFGNITGFFGGFRAPFDGTARS
jgi:hypothetical protein